MRRCIRGVICLNCSRCATEESTSDHYAVIVGERPQVTALRTVKSAHLHGYKRMGRNPS